MNLYAKCTVTSLSIHSGLIAKLHELSDTSGLTSNQIIVYCLYRYAKEVKIKLKLDGLSTYQPRTCKYQAFPVRLPQSLYEMGFDLRKSLKLSLSFIFAIAFMAYLDDLTKEERTSFLVQTEYSYREINYNGTHAYENGRHMFFYSWEIPLE